MTSPAPGGPPLILAFDSAAAHCAVAVTAGDRLLARRVEPMARGQVERLAALVTETLAEAGVALGDLALIGVGIGPGNFTGVRISVALARGLALSLGRPAIGVTRFEALAEEAGAQGPRHRVVAIAGRRGLVFAQAFGGDAAPGAPLSDTPGALAGVFRPLAPDLEIIGAFDPLAGLLGAPGRAGALVGEDGVGDRADPAAIARVAAQRPAGQPRPAPLYLRPADAAPPRDPPPRILA